MGLGYFANYVLFYSSREYVFGIREEDYSFFKINVLFQFQNLEKKIFFKYYIIFLGKKKDENEIRLLC